MDYNVISHPPGGRVFGIKSTYLELMIAQGHENIKYSQCAAAILTAMERWYDWKLGIRFEEFKQRQTGIAAGKSGYPLKTSVWYYQSQEGWVEELFGIFSKAKVRQSLEDLKKLKLIARRNNPYRKTDQTYQYLFRAAKIQAALDEMAGIQRDPKYRTALYKPQIEGLQIAKSKVAKRPLTFSNVPNRNINPHSPFTSSFHRSSSTFLDLKSPFQRNAPVEKEEREIELPEILIQFKNRFSGKPDTEELQKQIERLGTARAEEVIKRCIKAKGRVWSYVLTSLVNEPVGTLSAEPPPSSAAPPSLPVNTPVHSDARAAEIAALEAKRQAEQKRREECLRVGGDDWKFALHMAQHGYRNTGMLNILENARVIENGETGWKIAIPETWFALAKRLERDIQALLGRREIEWVTAPVS